MSGWILTFGLLFTVMVTAAAEGSPPCAPPSGDEPYVSRSLFGLYHTREEMRLQFDSLYASGRRLRERAYWDAVRAAYVFPRPSGPVVIDPVFLQSIARHVELAHERGYVDFLFYPDMGHGHFFIPETDWRELEKISDASARYEKILRLRGLKVLYHTAELVLLKGDDPIHGPLPTDPWLAWRYYSRNILADNQGGENLAVLYAPNAVYNTVREVAGHVERPGIFISASRDGCFSYLKGGAIHHFDLTLGTLPSR